MKTVLNVQQVRADFPNLGLEVYGSPLVYFDNAASTLKPKGVIERLSQYYSHEVSNVHRGAHYLSDQGTRFFEAARENVRQFLGAQSASEIVFTRGTTESLNLVAASYGRAFLQTGDEIILTELEHHSNIVPWQMLCEEKGCRLRVVPIFANGELDLEAYRKLLSPRTKIVSFTWISNAIGTINPLAEMIRLAHEVGAKVVVDAAQAVANQGVDVQALDCDFLAFSGHKIFAPYGVGVLYGKQDLLNRMPPYQGGGSMIQDVSFKKTTYLASPHRFEAGTPAVGDVIGLSVALHYVQALGFPVIQEHEADLLNYATEQVGAIAGVRLLGTAAHKGPILSFVTEQGHPSDIGSLLDRSGVAVRTGHHCCQPLMRRLGVTGTVRASFSIYNTRAEVDIFVQALRKAQEFLNG